MWQAPNATVAITFGAVLERSAQRRSFSLSVFQRMVNVPAFMVELP
jgi:hypothetical protein